MELLIEELERRWRSMFERLTRGDDLPPGERLRTEGMMEAAVLVGAATADALLEKMEASFSAVSGQGFTESLGEDWREVFPFPQVPAMMRRAPVYPSTRD